jgi:hypothetical protein
MDLFIFINKGRIRSSVPCAQRLNASARLAELSLDLAGRVVERNPLLEFPPTEDSALRRSMTARTFQILPRQGNRCPLSGM